MRQVPLIVAALAGLLGLGSAYAAEERTELAPPPARGLSVATFAAGCFWCVEPPYDKLDGVVSTTSGYTAGKTVGPTYKQVSRGGTGHTEAVRVVYDPKKVEYKKLVDVFWRNVDLLDAGGQFCDRGPEYRPAIFVHNDEQKRIAEEFKAALAASGRFPKPIFVPVEPAQPFYVAEDYHQDYFQKNPINYRYYRAGCGRDSRLQELWGKPSS